MKLEVRKGTDRKVASRNKKRMRIRKKIFGTAVRPRLSVFRSGRHLYAQVIDDSKGGTIVSASTLQLNLVGANVKNSALVGAQLGKMALSAGIKQVVFDRGGYLYHGKVQALADAARGEGLKF